MVHGIWFLFLILTGSLLTALMCLTITMFNQIRSIFLDVSYPGVLRMKPHRCKHALRTRMTWSAWRAFNCLSWLSKLTLLLCKTSTGGDCEKEDVWWDFWLLERFTKNIKWEQHYCWSWTPTRNFVLYSSTSSAFTSCPPYWQEFG